MYLPLWTLFWMLTLHACNRNYIPQGQIGEEKRATIDYSNLNMWAAHPDKKDLADNTPEGRPLPSDIVADVFFVHPTSYTGDKGETLWNAQIEDAKVNKKTDDGAIKFQASAWNQAGRIFAPRYRQAHINVYFNKDKKSGYAALAIAYKDVKDAFEHYLKYHNGGRPIIIASHSQGSTHCQQLLVDYFDGKPLRNQLVAAYLLGMPVAKNKYKEIPPCTDADDIQCVISWRTYQAGFEPQYSNTGNVLVTNPLTWTLDTTKVNKEENPGTIFYDFNALIPGRTSAQVHNDILWAEKPKFKGSVFFRSKNYHIADVNFYYESIRRNAVNRVDTWKRSNLTK
jgi:hypothetical protein